MKGMKNIILASQSPRRKNLLTDMGVTFSVVPSNFEEHLDNSRDPEVVAKELALGKALDVAQYYPDAYVIGADTIVTINGKQLEKPTSPENAKELLRLLAGESNYVTTGISLVCINDNVRLSVATTTTVVFAPFDEAVVDEYIATGDPMDKAGAYSVQRLYGTLIDHVEGDFDTIMGLNTTSLAAMLKQCGIDAQAVVITADDLPKMV
ncbi:TPA: septum formation protein Maf [Candidatus Saccharibacteria bacterium]|nr:septum formation protein Maf [Candidatus Saccharibacteria bacterium]